MYCFDSQKQTDVRKFNFLSATGQEWKKMLMGYIKYSKYGLDDQELGSWTQNNR